MAAIAVASSSAATSFALLSARRGRDSCIAKTLIYRWKPIALASNVSFVGSTLLQIGKKSAACVLCFDLES